MNFKIDQKVVCIDVSSSGSHCAPITDRLTLGKVYTVMGIQKYLCCGVTGIDVGVGGDNPFTMCRCGAVRVSDGYVNASRFAPIVEGLEHEELSTTTAEDVLAFIELSKHIEAQF